jgi:hypothetical protein
MPNLPHLRLHDTVMLVKNVHCTFHADFRKRVWFFLSCSQTALNEWLL